jgi:hypothetical protein
MKTTNLFLIILFLFSFFELAAQHVVFPDDDKERGYFNRPYKRYEAEPEKCQTNGEFLEANFNQKTIQSEASNQMAIELYFQNSYVEWVNDEAADGMTIRFSLPDGETGLGTKGTVALYVNEVFIRDITLDSYWAWQYFKKNTGDKDADNQPDVNSFPRMRFDEMHVKLDNKIPAGATFKLVKTEDTDSPYVIDFVELEPVPDPVTFESIPDANKVKFEGGNLKTFIESNDGKTIYIPAGKHNVSQRIYIRTNGTKLTGAGMWHTEIYFDAPSDNAGTSGNRGIETNSNHIVIEGLYFNTFNNRRYYQNNGQQFQVGKALMGSFGSNSVIKNVWAEHFECGAWIADYGSNSLFSDNLLVQHCRFRNNYADGINLCRGTKNAIVEYCSFRNNGDDDMASWSSDYICKNNTFRYCTSENNWRASGLGLFGGENFQAHHIVIADAMENALRANSNFRGTGFSATGKNIFSHISIYRGGTAGGTMGEYGDLWGNPQGAVSISTTNLYEVKNICLDRLDIHDSKRDAIVVESPNNSEKIVNLSLKNIVINGATRYGIYFNSARGNGEFCNLVFENIGNRDMNSLGSFRFVENCDTGIPFYSNELVVYNLNNDLIIKGFDASVISVYDVSGRKIYQTGLLQEEAVIPNLETGFYIVKIEDSNKVFKVLVNN